MSAAEFVEEDYSKRLDLSLWKRVITRMMAYKRYVLPMGAVAICTASVDAMFPLVTRGVIDELVRNGANASLASYGWAYLALVAALSLCIYAFIILAGKVSTTFSHDLRRDGFRHLQDLSFSYYDERPAGWIMARMTSDCQRLAETIAWALLDTIWAFALVVAITTILLWMNWQLALAVLAVMPLMAAVSVFFQKRMLRTARGIRKANSRLTAAYNEGIMGARTTKILVREEENLEEFGQKSTEMFRVSVNNALYSALYFPLILTLGSVSLGVALWLGGVLQMSEAITLGTVVAFMSYARQFFEPLNMIARHFAQLQNAQASAERIFSMIDTQPDVRDSDEVLQAIQTARGKPLEPGVAIDGGDERIGEIEFRNVCFEYKSGEPVLEDFNLKVAAGTSVALVGPTGGGKSTIVALLCRFYEPTSGEILINGVDYRRRSQHWLQSNLGIVLQTPHLFSGTVRDNIRYGNLQASDEAIVRAAKRVAADGFIESMDQGYDSEVGKAGSRLSTGQKQLLSFARAVLADPQIFVMDEATSSVDTHTEQEIQSGLKKVLAGRTSFIIAHRLSTIRSSDLILVIDKGRIAERGDHHDLIGQKGHYFELYTNQFTHENENRILEEAMED